jgi:hypothetical protein
MSKKSKEIITPKGNKIKITYHDKFHYTDALGNRKEIEGKELFSDLFDATDIIKDVSQLVSMHNFHRQGLTQLEPVLRAKACMDNLWWIEHKLYNMNFAFNLSGVFDDKNKQLLMDSFADYQPIYDESDHKYILDLHIEIATKEDNWQLYLSLKEQYLEKVSTLLQFDKEPTDTDEVKVVNYSVDDANKYFEWLCDPKNVGQDVPKDLQMMMQNRNQFRTRFNRWFDKLHIEHNPPIDLEQHYKKLETALHNNPVKITDLPSPRFDYALGKPYHILFYNLLFNKFKYWFDRKNERGLVVQWQEIGTKDVKMPHLILLDKNFENRLAEQNRQDKLLEERVADMEIDHFKDMTIDEAMKWVKEINPINDDIEII